MIKRLIFFLSILINSFSMSVYASPAASGLEIDSAQDLYLVYMIETDDIDKCDIKAFVNSKLSDAGIQQVKRDDAQLFLRVEKHAGEYLLYLDFSRKISYQAQGKTFEKDGFVWGRYIKDISDTEALIEDIEFVIDDFIQAYKRINNI